MAGRAAATPSRRHPSRSRRSPVAGRWRDDDSHRQPAHRAFGDGTCLGPAAEQEQRVGHVARQEVAVERPRVRRAARPRSPRTRRRPPPRGGSGGRGPLSGWPGCGRARLDRSAPGRRDTASRSSSTASDGFLPHARATARVVIACTSWDRATGSQARATLIASRASRCASEKMPSSIFSWASVARTVGPLGARFSRDELDRPSRREHRPGGVPGSAPDMGQPLVEEAQRDAIAPSIETADRQFEIGRRPRHLADREGRLRERLGGRPGPTLVAPSAGRPLSAAGLRGATAPAPGTRARRPRRGDRRRTPPPRWPRSAPAVGRGRPASARRRPTAVRPGFAPMPRDSGCGRSAAGRVPRHVRSMRGGRR